MIPDFSDQGTRRLLGCAVLGAMVLAASAAPRPTDAPTALDRYVTAADPAYAWRRESTVREGGLEIHTLRMTSQEWLTTNEVNRTRWEHVLLVARPERATPGPALLFISGGANQGDRSAAAPTREIAAVARATGSIVAELKMVPNQPLVFRGDGKARYEDDLIGYSWDQFLRTGDERWPARLPMTKAAVRAMDTVTAFMAGEDGGGMTVDRFVVAGASKRGWTAWMTAAVDDRVVAVCPIVIDVLNVEASMKHHFQAYGFFAPAVGDYVRHGIMRWLDTSESAALYAIEDPFHYRDRLTLPKLLIHATGDQFFLPDSSRFYFDELRGPKFLRYVPNADHSLKGSDALETLAAWHHLTRTGGRAPDFTWRHGEDGTLSVSSVTRPRQALLWQASNPTTRDFRLETIGPAFRSTEVEPAEGGRFVYTTRVPKPAGGWTAYFIELTFDVGAPTPLKLTTDVRVTPETLNFPKPEGTAPKDFLTR